ncbi:hypothetical protein V5P93_004111 [Actinokineospora auranticolor]|uniref:Secreted protein n=1 Tax=Actinokineospora auranticolor TaxID=155976 RepID=A0A2S6GDK3_9PSEU|nr:hypothetical protein [Actinokineospora auranticolor]PPK63176.1 hypothetical protein CLV40_13145 [Actinokineospora auranticolor]
MTRTTLLGALAASAACVVALAAPASAAPAGSYWSCELPGGYTYTDSGITQGCAHLFYVTAPSTGLWACYVPTGYTHTAVQRSNKCWLNGSNSQYLLAAV